MGSKPRAMRSKQGAHVQRRREQFGPRLSENRKWVDAHEPPDIDEADDAYALPRPAPRRVRGK